MAINIPTKITNSLDGYLLDAENVKGTYLVVNSYEELANLPEATIVDGSLAYCQTDYSTYSAGFYKYNGSSWESWGIGVGAATYNDLGGVKLGSATQSSQTIETASSTAGRQYPVQVDSNGRASVNVPWTDTKELYECTYGTTTYAEITQALSDGKLPVCIYSNRFYKYDLKSPTDRYIFNTHYSDALYTLNVQSNDTWGAGNTQFEITSNKVTSINSSSTNSQYPSAKLLYDQLLLKQDKLPTIVNDRYLHTNSSTGNLEWSQLSVPNVVQDLTTNTAGTLDSTAWETLKSTHTETIASPTMTGLDSSYEFVNIKLSINNVNQFVKLAKNTTNKYSGLFFIEESTNLYEITIYYNGTNIILRCATVI